MRSPIENCRPHVISLAKELQEADEQLSLPHYKGMALNSWEREYLLPFMSDETLLYRLDHALSHCRQRDNPNEPCITYDESVIHTLTPELICRFKESKGIS
jgi:hypothetical protein